MPKPDYYFIDIKRIYGRDQENTDTSSLMVSNRNPDGTLQVVGVLPHNCCIAPKTQADADLIRAWLDKYYPLKESSGPTKQAMALQTAIDMLEECRRYINTDIADTIDTVLQSCRNAL